MPGFKLYQVIGRKAPTAAEPDPPVYRMKLFAPNEVLARSRFWYYMHQYRKMKKTTGEILDIVEVSLKQDLKKEDKQENTLCWRKHLVYVFF